MSLAGHYSDVVNGYYYVVTIGIFDDVSFYPSLLSLIVELFLIYGYVSNLAVQFLYRFFLLCRNKSMSLLQFVLLVLIGYIPTLIYVIWILQYVISTPELPSDEQNAILKDTVFDHNGRYPQFFARPADPLQEKVLAIVAVCVIYYIIVILCISAVYCSMLTLRKSMSKSTQQAHRQLNIILCFEAFVPLFSVIIPVLVDIVAIFDISLPLLRNLCSIMIILTPVFTAIVKMVSVKAYRQSIVGIFCFDNRKQAGASTSLVTVY
uniref:G protein-coupled receptor n=1 Tax=Panagrellus redivivus TaxID=6233 RepID=A0A7E4V982_PANRE